MLEHSFYQGLNLLQIIMFHAFGSLLATISIPTRLFCVIVVTTPWLFRSNFPVHSFSKNYTEVDRRSTSFVRLLYRLKKYQYVFYKHALLHGLNISIALRHHNNLIHEQVFLFYWLDLNTSYVLEFFLQV